MNLPKSIEAAADNPRRVDLIVAYATNKLLSGRPLEVVLAYLDTALATHSDLIKDTVSFCLSCVPHLKERLSEVEKGASVNLAGDEHITKWISGLAWAIVVSSECGIPSNGVHAWLDAGSSDSGEESTWLSFQFGEVTIARRDWQGAVWQGNFDAAVSSVPPKDDEMNKFWDLRYISWRNERFGAGIPIEG